MREGEREIRGERNIKVQIRGRKIKEKLEKRKDGREGMKMI